MASNKFTLELGLCYLVTTLTGERIKIKVKGGNPPMFEINGQPVTHQLPWFTSIEEVDC